MNMPKLNRRSLGLLLVLLAAPTLADQAADCVNCRKEALKAAEICLAGASSEAAKKACHEKMDSDVEACSQGACNY